MRASGRKTEVKAPEESSQPDKLRLSSKLVKGSQDYDEEAAQAYADEKARLERERDTAHAASKEKAKREKERAQAALLEKRKAMKDRQQKKEADEKAKEEKGVPDFHHFSVNTKKAINKLKNVNKFLKMAGGGGGLGAMFGGGAQARASPARTQ